MSRFESRDAADKLSDSELADELNAIQARLAKLERQLAERKAVHARSTPADERQPPQPDGEPAGS